MRSSSKTKQFFRGTTVGLWNKVCDLLVKKSDEAKVSPFLGKTEAGEDSFLAITMLAHVSGRGLPVFSGNSRQEN